MTSTDLKSEKGTQMKLTIKKTTRTGKPATAASDKQINFANDIINRINATLEEVANLGFIEIADEVATSLDRITDVGNSGAIDIINYLKDYDRYRVFSECYGVARKNRNFAAVNALNPRKLQELNATTIADDYEARSRQQI